ncbi:hypothetical protein BS17DRAFT_822988 [Gyrodon lividus]|nr:hypothetical protein BS17DRAFT_822988 [Gyrodon lividus]
MQHHQCLFVPDNQIRYLDEKSFVSLGQWLVDKGVLRDEWNAQVAHQTKPLPSESLE